MLLHGDPWKIIASSTVSIGKFKVERSWSLTIQSIDNTYYIINNTILTNTEPIMLKMYTVSKIVLIIYTRTSLSLVTIAIISEKGALNVTKINLGGDTIYCNICCLPGLNFGRKFWC